MRNRPVKRGVMVRFLAVTAATTMLLAGLVGVGLAAPANAVDGTKSISAQAINDHGCDATEWHFIINQLASDSDAPATINVTWANGQSADVPLDPPVTGGAAHYRTTANLDSPVTGATAVIYSGWSGQFNLSHGPCGEQPKVGVEVNGDFECVPANREAPAQWRLIWTVKNTSTNAADLRLADDEGTGFADVPSGESVDYWQYVKTTGKYTLSWIAVNDDGTSAPVTGEITVTGQCGNTAEITCSTWSASLSLPPVLIDDDLYDEFVYPRSVNKTGVVEVFIDGKLIATDQLDEMGNWSGGGSITPPFQDGLTHTLTVTVDGGAPIVTATSGTCAVPTCQELNNCPPPDNPPATTTDTPVTPVVEAATVAVPVEAPAAAAPAPATVAVPAKATLPAAVPAGDGSQAPGLPLWAVALMVAGLLGAVGAFTGLRRSRN